MAVKSVMFLDVDKRGALVSLAAPKRKRMAMRRCLR